MRRTVQQMLEEEKALAIGRGCKPSPDIYTPRKRALEITSTGIDEYLQGYGGDAANSLTSTGLRVPTAPYNIGGEGGQVGRYLFQLATVRIGAGRRIKVRGMRQMSTIGYAQTGGSNPRVIELPIHTINFRFQDGNICWYLRRVDAKPKNPHKVLDSDNFRFRFADTSGTGALLYENATFPAQDLSPQGRPDFYTTLTSYTPPNGGFPYGQSVAGTLGDFRDLRGFTWEERAWQGLEIIVEGPCWLVFFCSLRQTNPATRTALTLGQSTSYAGLPQEEQFLLQFPNTIYWRVAGTIVYEDLDGTSGGGSGLKD